MLGAGNKEKLNDSIHTIYAFSIAGSIFFTVVGIAASPALLALMNTAPELMEDSVLYLRIYFGGSLFVFIYNTGSSILRALGDSKRPLYYLIVCCMINIALDLVTVSVLDMGDVVVPMLITTVAVCVLRVLWIVVVTGIYPSMDAVIFNYPVTWVASGMLFIFYYKYRIKKIDAMFTKKDV